MIRFLFRFVGLLSLALGFVFLVYDGTKTIADQKLYITKVSDVWAAVHESSLAQVKPALERIAPWLWDAVNYVLNAPSCVVLVIIGALLLLIGRKKKRLIGYARD